MGISRYNAEGYADPTAFAALSVIKTEERKQRKFRPLVYICSPFAGDVDNNIEAARRFSRFAVDSGYIPIAPHLLFPQFLNDNIVRERQLGLFFGNVLLTKCAELWVFGDRISGGMEDEISRAEQKNYTIRYFTEASGGIMEVKL